MCTGSWLWALLSKLGDDNCPASGALKVRVWLFGFAPVCANPSMSQVLTMEFSYSFLRFFVFFFALLFWLQEVWYMVLVFDTDDTTDA